MVIIPVYTHDVDRIGRLKLYTMNIQYEINNTAPEEKKRFIRKMFASIAPSYDALNKIFSLGTDMLWRASAVKSLGDVKGKLCLDLCCGTGDISQILHKRGAEVISLDFCIDMIQRAIAKNNIYLPLAADASLLPLKSNAFDILTIAFGIRNIPDINNFITETFRVLRPGGTLLILELTRPKSRLAGFFYNLYLTKILPQIGGLISGKRQAYKYLAETINTFIDPVILKDLFLQNGFSDALIHSYTFGIATVIKCIKR